MFYGKNDFDNYEIIDLDELVEKAIIGKKINNLIVDKILQMNNDNVNSFNEFLEKKVVDFEVENDDTFELPIEHFIKELSVKSKNISNYIEENPLTNFENNNLLLVKGNQKINEDVLKQQNFKIKDKDKHKKSVQKIKFLLLLTGIFITITLLILSFVANDIEAVTNWISDKILSKKIASNYVKKVSQIFIFIIGFV